MRLTPAIAIARKLAGYIPPVIDGGMCCANCGAVECKTKRHKRYKCVLHMFYVHSRGVCPKWQKERYNPPAPPSPPKPPFVQEEMFK